MPFYIVQNDITGMHVDAIVNAANESLLGGGGVDGAIHRAAGPELLRECRTLGGCKTGQAKITKGYRLPARFVIHTVGPIWRGGTHGEQSLLTSAYRSSLELALAHGCKSVAFPLISSGAYAYPADQALAVAVNTIGEFLLLHDMTVSLVIFDRPAYSVGSQLFSRLSAYIRSRCAAADSAAPTALSPAPPAARPDENFRRLLQQKMDEKNISVPLFCKKANLGHGALAGFCTNSGPRPSKGLIWAFAIALELSPEEACRMLCGAGTPFCSADPRDAIVEYFITQQNYNIFEINAALFAFDQSQLGS